MAFVVYVNSGDVRGRLARALARGAEVKRTSKQGARETPKLQGSTCSAWARVFQTASVSHSESLAAKRFSSWHLYTHPSSFSIIVVSRPMFLRCSQTMWAHSHVIWSRAARYSQLIWSQNSDVFGPGDLCSRAATCIYFIAYRFYALFIARKVIGVDPTRQTPAYRHNDGLDYVPTNRYVRFGHHFAAIGGAGPLVGLVLAA